MAKDKKFNIATFFNEYNSAKELQELARLQMGEDGHITNLNDFLGNVQRITGVTLPQVPENAAGLDIKTFRAYENMALSASISALGNWLNNPDNYRRAKSYWENSKKIKEQYQKEIDEINDRIKKREEERQKKEEEAKKQKEEEDKEKKEEEAKKQKEEEDKEKESKKEKEETRDEATKNVDSYYKTLGLNNFASEEEIENAYQELIKNRSQMSSEEAAAVENSYHFLVNYKNTYDKQLRVQLRNEVTRISTEKAAAKELSPEETLKVKVDPSWKYVVTLHPNLTPGSSDWSDMSDQMQRANNNIGAFRNDDTLNGFISFSSKEIEKFKKDGLIPASLSDEEANSILNVSRMLWMRGGTATGMIKALEDNGDITPEQNGFFESIALNIAALEESNPTLSGNLHLSAGRPNIAIEKPNENNINQDDFGQIALEIKDNILIPLFENLKSISSDKIKNFIVDSLGSKASKKVAKLAEKIGTKAAIEKIRGALEILIPGAGKLFVDFLNLFGGIVDKALLWLKKLIEENKEAIAALGVLGVVFIGLGLTALGVALVVVAGAALLIAGGTAVAVTGAVSTVFVVIPIIIASLPIVSIILWAGAIILAIILLTALTLFIINSGGYIIPQYTFLPFGAICTNTKVHVDFAKNSPSSIAKRAWEITDDLYQGFWCFWNRSPGDVPSDSIEHPPSYPELFDYPLYLINPNPPRSAVENDENSLFWCTQLVYKSYKETGNSIGGGYNSSNMLLWFKGRGRFYMNANSIYTITTKFPQYLSPKIASLSDVVDGSVIFFFVHGGPDRVNHVAVVHHTECNGSLSGQVCSIFFVQANAGDKQGTISYTTLSGIQNLSDEIEIIGFGKP